MGNSSNLKSLFRLKFQNRVKEEHNNVTNETKIELISESLIQTDPLDVVVSGEAILDSSFIQSNPEMSLDEKVKTNRKTTKRGRQPKVVKTSDGREVLKRPRKKKGEGRSYVIGLLDRSADNKGWKCQKCGDEFYRVRSVQMTNNLVLIYLTDNLVSLAWGPGAN